MPRKKWTPQTEVNETILQLRERRKWQIALRRYVLESNKSSFYAPYFGLDIEHFRAWIQLQFDSDTNWDNFSKAWQFDQIVPLSYFNFQAEQDLLLCWNFTNTRIEKLQSNKSEDPGIDTLSAKSYFQNLFDHTGYTVCKKMVERIERIEASQTAEMEKFERFIFELKPHLDLLAGFSSYEYDKLNTGTDVRTIQYEKQFLKKFGS
ncbi:MAG: hypothetical protein ACJ75B_15535 [Flavisolibacter sp.]